MADRDADLLDLLAAHESAIKRLYEAFARRFPERAGLWRGIAAEEQRHADWLSGLRDTATPAARSWLASRFKAQAIRLSTAYVEERTAAAGSGALDLRGALSVSRDLENALLERQFSRLDEAVPAALRPVLRDLAAETDGHRRAFDAALAAL